MIPKVIHYCWFGGSPIPDSSQKCISSWKKYFPDYEIKQWDETNFDFNSCNYVKEAYQAKKWAFVSDYARFWILYNYGGIYFDTDVEVIKPFDDILISGSFMGEEISAADSNNEEQEDIFRVNAGLGIGAESNTSLYKEILDYYKGEHFINNDGTENHETVVTRVTNILLRYGFKGNGAIEDIDGFRFYPPEYFSPINYKTSVITITANTHSIHHYTGSWQTEWEKKETEKMQELTKKYGPSKANIYFKIWKYILHPSKLIEKVNI